MRSFAGSVKLRSPGLWPAILTLATTAALGGALTGCFIVREERHQSSPPPEETPAPSTPPVDDKPLQVPIETDKALDWTAGDGVGMFVEYTSGGHWHVWASCDTNLSSAICNFDAFVTVASGDELSNLQGDNLESGDVVEALGDGSFHLATRTSSEFDGMTFDTNPGAVIEIEAYLDGERDPHIIYWYSTDANGTGVVHEGAPTNPIDFKPSKP